MSVYKANIIRYGQQGMWCFLYYLSVLITVGKRLLGLHMSQHLTLKSNNLNE